MEGRFRRRVGSYDWGPHLKLREATARTDQQQQIYGAGPGSQIFISLLACMALIPLTPLSVAIGTLVFFVGALLLSRVFFKLQHPRSALLNSMGGLEVVQRDFRRTVEANRNDRRACTD